MVFGLFGWEIVAVTFFRDPGIGSGSAFVEPLNGFRDISLMSLVSCFGGKIPLDR
jgi:hypothetical protein